MGIIHSFYSLNLKNCIFNRLLHCMFSSVNPACVLAKYLLLGFNYWMLFNETLTPGWCGNCVEIKLIFSSIFIKLFVLFSAPYCLCSNLKWPCWGTTFPGGGMFLQEKEGKKALMHHIKSVIKIKVWVHFQTFSPKDEDFYNDTFLWQEARVTWKFRQRRGRGSSVSSLE